MELQHKAADLILQYRELNASMNTAVTEFNKMHLLLRRHRVLYGYLAIQSEKMTRVMNTLMNWRRKRTLHSRTSQRRRKKRIQRRMIQRMRRTKRIQRRRNKRVLVHRVEARELLTTR